MAEGLSPAARRFTVAWSAGSAVATAAYLWMVSAGTGNLFRYERLNSDFYEVQARELLHGRLAMPAHTLNIEGFRHAGKTYMYFPPFPALMRLPVVAITDGLDGRLTALSMLCAFVLALAGTGVLVWRIRGVMRADAPLGRIEALATGLLAVLVGVGSPLFFGASRPWVYHEAAIWALAFAICAYDQVIAFLRDPTRGRLVRAGAFAGGALLSRATIGAGPLLALALALVVVLALRWRPASRRVDNVAGWLGVNRRLADGRDWSSGIAAAVAIPAVLYVAVNLAKFARPFSVPYDRQVQNLLDPHRRRVLAANDGSLFTLRAIPTQLLQMLRPDGISLSRTFPWIGFPSARPTVVGGLRFDRLDPTVSITAAMPVVVVFAIVGAVVVLRRGALGPVRTCALAALIVLPTTLSFLYAAQRYDSDLLPLLVLLGVVGYVAATAALARRSPPFRRGAAVAFTAGVLLGAWTGVAVALEYQRALAPLVADDLRHQYVEWQSDVAARLGLPPLTVGRGPGLPRPGPRNALFAIGDCDALYVSDGFEWQGVERTNRGGGFRLHTTFAPARAGTTEPVLTVGTGPDRYVFAVEHLGGGRAVFVEETRSLRGEPFTIGDGASDLEVVIDPQLQVMRILRDRHQLLGADFAADLGDVALGSDAANPTRRFEGTIESRPMRPELCRTVAARAR